MNRFRYFSVILYESHIQGMITKQRSLFQEEHTEVGSTSNIYLKAPRALVPTSLSPWDIIIEKRNAGVTASRNLCEPVRQETSSLNYFHYPLFLKPVSLEYIYPKTTSMNLLIGPQLQDQLLQVTFLAPLLEPSSSRSPSSRWTFVAPYSSIHPWPPRAHLFEAQPPYASVLELHQSLRHDYDLVAAHQPREPH